MFSDCYTDFSLFNPFDALSQENLLALGTKPSTNNSTATNIQITYNNNTKTASTPKVPKITIDPDSRRPRKHG